MKSAGKARNNGLYRHIRTSKEIIRNLLNDSQKNTICGLHSICPLPVCFDKRLAVLYNIYKIVQNI